MYAVEVEAGRLDPIPEYFSDWQVARWMGVTKQDLLHMPIADVEEARITMTAISEAERQQAGRATK